MNYTDTQLKQALAKMLPEKCYMTDNKLLAWNEARLFPLLQPQDLHGRIVLDTELLHLCWLVNDTLSLHDWYEVCEILEGLIWSSWQQRVKALANVKGIEI
jgi:hypothetical protein